MRKRNIYLLFGLITVIAVYSLVTCNTDKEKLSSYYKSNTDLHKEIADSLNRFIKTYGQDITIKRSTSSGKIITVRVYFRDINTWLPIEYDSAFARKDLQPDRTSSLYVPLTLLKNFNKSIYWAVSSNDSLTFFAFKWETKFGIGTRGDSQIGIMIHKKPIADSLTNGQLAPGVYITSSSIP
ncbi:MAG: hypothetical protein ABI480_08410 [Chitinophagaceae bacterium]